MREFVTFFNVNLILIIQERLKLGNTTDPAIAPQQSPVVHRQYTERSLSQQHQTEHRQNQEKLNK